MTFHEDYLRSALFGVQDGIVSTTGVVVGISSGDRALAIPATVIAALAMLLLVGYVKGRMVHTRPVRSALELLAIGGVATAIGLIVGNLRKI